MIRKLLKKDIKNCVEICNYHFNNEGYSYDVESELLSSFIKTQYITPEYYVFIEDNIIKGIGRLNNCGWDDGIFGLCTCYIHQDYQFKGIGKKLTEFRINRIKELGGEIIFSTTKKTWHLERFGFKVIDSSYKIWSVMQLIIK